MLGGAAKQAAEGREIWKSNFDFGFAYFALTLGFQHLWRFPYLMYKNGGGNVRQVLLHLSTPNQTCPLSLKSTFPLKNIVNVIQGAFLIPWLICNGLVGFPLVLLEVAFGQHTGLTGPAALGKAAPVLKGVGFSVLSMNLISSTFWPSMFIAWAATYFFQSFLNLPVLPWGEDNDNQPNATLFWE